MNKQDEQKVTATDNSMAATRGKGGGGEVEEGKGSQIHGVRRRLDFGW